MSQVQERLVSTTSISILDQLQDAFSHPISTVSFLLPPFGPFTHLALPRLDNVCSVASKQHVDGQERPAHLLRRGAVTQHEASQSTRNKAGPNCSSQSRGESAHGAAQ